MKKQLMIIGIIVLLITIGLSGCNETGIGLTDIGDLVANPENYLGEDVKVKGVIIGNLICDNSGLSFPFKLKNSLSGEYYLTGIVAYGNPEGIPPSPIDTNEYYLNVTKAEAV